MSTDLDALIYRISHLEARVNELEPASETVVRNDAVLPSSVTGGTELIILDAPVSLASGTGGLSWTTQSGPWPTNATHVYLSITQGDGAGNFELRKDSSATGYAVCGAVSANNFSGGVAACAFAALSTSSTFDWRDLANNAYTLTLVGYLVPVS